MHVRGISPQRDWEAVAFTAEGARKGQDTANWNRNSSQCTVSVEDKAVLGAGLGLDLTSHSRGSHRHRGSSALRASQIHSLPPKAIRLLEAQRSALPFMFRRQALSAVIALLAFLPLLTLGAGVTSRALLTLWPLRAFRPLDTGVSLWAGLTLRAFGAFRASSAGLAVSACRALDTLHTALTLRAFGTDFHPERAGIALRGSASRSVLHAFPDLSIQRHAVKHDIAFRAAVFTLKDRAYPAKRHARHTSPPVRRLH